MLIARLSIIFLLLVATSVEVRADALNGQVTSVTGDAFLIGPDGKSVKLTVGAAIPAGSNLSTGAGSRLAVQWMPGALSVLTANASLSVTALSLTGADGAPNRTIALNLVRGSIFSHSLQSDGKSDFRIATAQGDSIVAGADWKVMVQSDKSVTVSCLTGSVDVAAKALSLKLGHGQMVKLPLGETAQLTVDDTMEIIDLLADTGVAVGSNGIVMLDQSRDNGAGTLREMPYSADHFIQPRDHFIEPASR